MKKIKQLFSMIAVIAMVLVIGVTAYAAGDVTLGEETETQGQRGQRRGDKGHGGGNLLEEAVEAGIITQSEADAIEAYKEANRPDKDEVEEATEGMTKEEAKAYMEATYGPKPEPFDGLVEAGIISQEQVDALTELAPAKGERSEREKGQKGGQLLEEAVESGIIDEAQVEQIEAYKEANRPDMDEVKVATEGMTREEVKAYMEATYGPKPEPFEGLVEAGILTQEQVDALLELIPEKPEQGEGFEGQRRAGGRGEGQGHGPKGTNGSQPDEANQGTNSL